MQKLLELTVDTTTVYPKGKEHGADTVLTTSRALRLHFWNAPMLSALYEGSSSKD
jgi:hypothetical protein